MDAVDPREAFARARTFWLRVGDQVQGPGPRDELRGLASLGRLPPTAEISADGESWVPVADVPWLTRPPTKAEKEQAEAREYTERLALLTPRVWFTRVLVALNAGAFVLCLATGVSALDPTARDLIDVGGNFGPRVFAGEPWRLFTAMFLHAGLVHILVNMNALASLGDMLERFLGTAGFALVYVGSGLAASRLSVAVHPGIVSVGASGAIFGAIGALFPVLWRQRRGTMPRALLKSLWKGMLITMVLNLGLTFLVPGIDASAHLGGLVAGAAIGLLVAHPLDAAGAAGRRRRVLLATGVTVLGLVGLHLALPSLSPTRCAVGELLLVDEEVTGALFEQWDGPPEALARGKRTQIREHFAPALERAQRQFEKAAPASSGDQDLRARGLELLAVRRVVLEGLADIARLESDTSPGSVRRRNEQIRETSELVERALRKALELRRTLSAGL